MTESSIISEKPLKKPQKSKLSGFVMSAGIMTAGLLLAKIIGAFYRIPLTNFLGAEGMGVYQLIYPIYSFMLSTSSGALPVAISLIVSEKLASGDKDGADNVLKNAMTVMLTTGALLAAALAALSKPIGLLQGNTDTVLGYLAIAPAILCVSGIAVLRGWFQGNSNMVPTAVSQITEAVVKLAAGLTLAYLLRGYGIPYAVFGAMLGVTLSEAVTLTVLYILYRKKEPPLRLTADFKTARSEYKQIIRISFPIMIGSVILPLTQIIDSLLVVNILARTQDAAGATASYGLFTGYVATLINLPIVLGLSLGIAVVPSLSDSKTERNITAIKEKCDSAVKLALIIGVPFAFVYATMGDGVLRLLYPSITAAELKEATLLLQIGAGSVISLSVAQIYTSILQGIGSTYKPVINMSIGAGFKIVLDLILLPTIGIAGVAVASLVCFVVAMLLNGYVEIKLLGKSPRLIKNSGVIVLIGVIMSAVILLARYFAHGKFAVLAVIIPAMAVYFLLLLVFGVFSENELYGLPFGAKLVKIAKKITLRGRKNA